VEIVIEIPASDIVPTAVVQSAAPRYNGRYGHRIKPMLHGQHPRRQPIRMVIGQHRHHGLGQDWAMVELRRHRVHRATVEGDARLQGLLMGVQPLERRQQGRMDIEHLVTKALAEIRRQDPHESGQDHDIGLPGPHHLGHRRIEGLARGIVMMRDHLHGNATGSRMGQPLGLSSVREHADHPHRPPMGLDRLQQRQKVRTTPRQQHDDPTDAIRCRGCQGRRHGVVVYRHPIIDRLVRPSGYHANMLIFQGISPSRAPRRDRAITIGNFDGVHVGHQALIDRVIALAKPAGLLSTVVTFEPHPKALFNPQAAPNKIQGLRGKVLALAEHGVEELRILKFRRALASMTADDFMRVVLQDHLQTRAIVIGDDFRFGSKRGGDVSLLRQASSTHGWTVHTVQEVQVQGERVSSSRLRQALRQGDLATATQLMGRPYSLAGHVIHGRKIGRGIGFPTLNIPVHRDLLINGVFVVSVEGIGPAPMPAVASLGRRPTTEDAGHLLLEVHVLDWSGEVYGQRVQVVFHEKLRDEQHFPDMVLMTRQIQRDADSARHYFSHHVH